MRFRKKKWGKILILCIICLLVCVIIPLNASSTKTFESEKENKLNTGMKTIYMKADCSKIILYKVWWFPVHIGSFWFTSEYAYLSFIIEKDFNLKLNGVNQEVKPPVMVTPWKYIGFGPLWSKRGSSDGNVTLIGICEDVIIAPLNNN